MVLVKLSSLLGLSVRTRMQVSTGLCSVELRHELMCLLLCHPLVTTSLVINLYSALYMIEDTRSVEFTLLMYFFLSSMSGLVKSSTTLCLYLLQEGIGPTSFLLISFQYTRIYSTRSNLQAIGYSHLGDIFLLSGSPSLAEYGVILFCYT